MFYFTRWHNGTVTVHKGTHTALDSANSINKRIQIIQPTE